MGTWSQPLFCRVSHGAPTDYTINTSSWPSSEIDSWIPTGFFHDPLAPTKTEWSLSEFMDTGCHSHQILDHLDRPQINRWICLIAHILTDYPTLDWVQFHFWSSDAVFPYYLEGRRDSPDKLFLHSPTQEASNIALYLVPLPTRWFPFFWTAATETDDTRKLDLTAYSRNVGRITFEKKTYSKTVIIPTAVLMWNALG